MIIIYLIIALFAVTTILGLYLSSLVLQNRVTSKPIIFIHGVFTSLGFLLLLFYLPESLKSVVSLLIATAFGLTLLYQDLTHKKFSKWLCFAHGIMTIIGLCYLLMLASELN